MQKSNLLAVSSLFVASFAYAQQNPSQAAAPWWHETSALASDAMEGRDTGSQAYERAAKYVADKFAKAGLTPAGDKGTFFQRVPMHQTDLDLTRSSVEIISDTPGVGPVPLKLVEEITLVPRAHHDAAVEGDLVFLGYGLPLPRTEDLKGRVAVIFNNTPADLSPEDRASFAGRRTKALSAAEVGAILSIDNPAAIEPFHWPAAYARSVTLATARNSGNVPDSPLLLRISAAAAPKIFVQDATLRAEELLHDGAKGVALPSFPMHARLRIHITSTEKDISSPNVLAILPGSDPTLTQEYVALSAHLDGYGHGTPVLGDNLYNGALDDAAYVATLLDLASHDARLPPPARPKRSLLLCIFTGEEKGLLGSAWFTEHPTVPVVQIVADLNLDQLRPIFPLKILTMEGIGDSTLGETARIVAARYKIQIRPDLEPERNLFRRADNYNFVRVGVPIASFIFGYNRGTQEEATYRGWYARRYHKPQDDVSTPIDWQAAVTFNDFFRDLAHAVANAPNRPQWSPTSSYRPANTTVRSLP